MARPAPAMPNPSGKISSQAIPACSTSTQPSAMAGRIVSPEPRSRLASTLNSHRVKIPAASRSP